MTRKDLEKTFYLIAKYWLGELQGFIKIGDNKEEIVKYFNEHYNGDFGVTEESYELLEVKATEILGDNDVSSNNKD